jgi:hypothetical protein
MAENVTQQQPKAVKVPSPRLYSHERLVAESEAFLGVPKHVVAGALVGTGAKDPLSLDDAKKAVANFGRSEQKVD